MGIHPTGTPEDIVPNYQRLRSVITPKHLADCYGVSNLVHIYDGQERGQGLLLTTGAGMLLSLMDQMPGCYVGIDAGGGKASDNLSRWIEAASFLFTHVAIVAWFTASNPETWSRLYLDKIAAHVPVAYWSNEELARGDRMTNPTEVRDWSDGIPKIRDDH